MNTIKTNSKISACMALLRNSLSEGNEKIKSTISEGKFDKSKTYDKIIAMIISNCMKKITDVEMETVFIK